MPSVPRPDLRLGKLPKEIEQALEPMRKALAMFADKAVAALNRSVVVGDTLQFETRTVEIQGDGAVGVESHTHDDRYYTETELARVQVYVAANSTTSFTNDTWTDVLYGLEYKDTHSAFASGTFTAPVSGVYACHGLIYWPSMSLGSLLSLRFIRGSDSRAWSVYRTAANTAEWFPHPGCTVDLAAGDTLKFQARQASGTTRSNGSNAWENWLSIARVSV